MIIYRGGIKMKKDEIISFMIEGVEEIRSTELNKIFPLLYNLNNRLNRYDNKRKNLRDAAIYFATPTKIGKTKLIIHDVFDNYRDTSEEQIYSAEETEDIVKTVILMKLYIDTSGWDRLWALLGIS
jgi:hypothetical protein